MLQIAIDPGLSGAIAALTMRGEFHGVEDLPVMRHPSGLSWIDPNEMREIIERWRWRTGETSHKELRFTIEHVSAMPKQGVSSMFNFGVGFGSILSVVQSYNCPMALVQSARWKKAMRLTSDKSLSLSLARMSFPMANLSLKKHEGRAEALLLADYSRREFNGAQS